MKQQNESVKKLEVGKDYVNVHDNDVVVIDRVSDILNKGFERLVYKNYMSCSDTSNWREASEEEVIEAFEKHLNHRFGEDWKTMKIKEKHPSSQLARPINKNSHAVAISKYYDGWVVWNKNGLLYCNGIWMERLGEKPLFITDDGMEVLNPEDWVYLVNPLFEKIERYARNSNIAISKEIVKVFYFEANADDYILWNKPVFSYNDIKKFQSGGEGTWWNVKAIAKERSKE